jgi:death on curing protein
VEEPVWVTKPAVLALHDEQLAEHGGSSGIREESLLDSALAKPHNVFAYGEDPTLVRLAASYAFGIARNHAFVDGNKRTALIVCVLFLNRNGWDITASKAEEYEAFLALAEGSLNEEALTAWLTRHAVPL